MVVEEITMGAGTIDKYLKKNLAFLKKSFDVKDKVSWKEAQAKYVKESDNSLAAIWYADMWDGLFYENYDDKVTGAIVKQAEQQRVEYIRKRQLLNTPGYEQFVSQQTDLGFSEDDIAGKIQTDIEQQQKAEAQRVDEQANFDRRSNAMMFAQQALSSKVTPEAAFVLRDATAGLQTPLGSPRPQGAGVAGTATKTPPKTTAEEIPAAAPPEQLSSQAIPTASTPTSAEVKAKASFDPLASFVGETPTDEEILRLRRIRQGKKA